VDTGVPDDPSWRKAVRHAAETDPDASDPVDQALARLLADPAAWVDAPSSLESNVAHAIRMRADASAHVRRRRPRRRATRTLTAAVAAAILAVGVAAALTAYRDTARTDFAAQLTGTDLAPSARASAAITKRRGGFTVMLDAHGLSPLPPGEFYQAWLENPVGTLVPIGTFSSSDRRITLWSGVSPKDFRTMTVTIEQSDGNQSSSDRRVLTGAVHAP
jgi:hypothetical protein